MAPSMVRKACRACRNSSGVISVGTCPFLMSALARSIISAAPTEASFSSASRTADALLRCKRRDSSFVVASASAVRDRAESAARCASCRRFGVSIAVFMLVGHRRQYRNGFFPSHPDIGLEDNPNDCLVLGERGNRASAVRVGALPRSEEHTSELQSLRHLVCRLLLEKKK